MENALMESVLARLSECPDVRFKSVMSALIRHLHEFLAEVELTPEEWMSAIQFLTATGKACTDKRQEFILLSDTLAVSMKVVDMAQRRACAAGATEATEATVQGPYYWEGAPEFPLGSDLAATGTAGVPTFYSGRVLDTAGQPLAGAQLDIWSGDGDGVYDMQREASEMLLRGRIRTDEQGRYYFWSIRPTFYPVPMDGPVGAMLKRMGRHPMRPGHIHMIVSANGHVPVTTHLFVAGSPYIDSDAVFGVRDSLLVEFLPCPAGTAPDGRELEIPYYTAEYTFRLAPEAQPAT